jgi:hypothetical protein
MKENHSDFINSITEAKKIVVDVHFEEETVSNKS